jgi:UDP-N-acetylmuramoyl-tripeptide--D-alanyl-D-alanine ligase
VSRLSQNRRIIQSILSLRSIVMVMSSLKSRLQPAKAVKYLYAVAYRLFMYPLAWIHRRFQRGCIVVGVSGSAGKTTTKDLCASVLAAFGSCIKTNASSNYRISVAKSVLRIRARHKFAIFEISESRPGSMDLPISIMKPDIGVLTVIGRDHFSSFRSLEAIAHEAGKLIATLPISGIAVLNVDDPLIRNIGEQCRCRLVWVGRDERATIRLVDVHSIWPEPLTFSFVHDGMEHQVVTRLHGEHLTVSCLTALGVAVALGLPILSAIAALEKAEPSIARMQLIKDRSGAVFIRDDWKAPHWTLTAPFDYVAAAIANRKIIVLGTVSDSSDSPSKRYVKIARKIRGLADISIFVGDEATKSLGKSGLLDGVTVWAFPDVQSAAVFLDGILADGDLVLLKGTNRQDHLERIILNRESPIKCWTMSCGLARFCRKCEFLRIQTGDSRNEPGSAVQVFSWSPVNGGAVLIVGLGNPGLRFRDTPHNLGAAVVDNFTEIRNKSWQNCETGYYSSVRILDKTVLLFKGSCAINRTGEALKTFLLQSPVAVGSIIVVHDDLDLPLGRVKYRGNVGHTSHKGVRSVEAALGHSPLAVLRIGAGRVNAGKEKSSDVVLQPFSHLEQEQVESVISDSGKVIEDILLNLRSEPLPTHSSPTSN